MKRLIVASFVAGLLGASLFAPAVAESGAQPPGGGVEAKPAPTIDTYIDWTGDSVYSFGHPDTSTYGQVITVPADETDLVRFRVYVSQYVGVGHLVLRGEVYAWDGSKATGTAVWEGAPRRIALQGVDGYRRLGFRVGGIELIAGAEYVLFASISKDYHHATDTYKLQWAKVADRSYRPGTFVFLNDKGHESRWTTTAWDTSYGIDLAFKAWLRPHV